MYLVCVFVSLYLCRYVCVRFIWFCEAAFYFSHLLGLKKEQQNNYDWWLANFGKYSTSDLIDRFTFDVMVTVPYKNTVYGVQGRAPFQILSYRRLIYVYINQKLVHNDR